VSRDNSHQPNFGLDSFEARATSELPLPLDRADDDRDVASGERLELIGTFLRAQGSVDLGRFTRLSDYVNYLGGFFTIQDVSLLSRTGSPTRVTFPDLRVRLADIAIVAQREEQPSPHAGPGSVIPKQRRRLVVMTEAHIVYGSVYLHSEGSMSAFIDAMDPHWIPMTGVRVRWLNDRRLAGRFAFALLQRSKIVGVATDTGPIARSAQGAARAVMPAVPRLSPVPSLFGAEPAPRATEPGPLGILAQRKAAAGF
jgi:hypothetical protein